MITEQPDGIIITISQGMLKERKGGYRGWLKEFMQAMDNENWTYWMRQGAKPKHPILYVYLCIGGKVRFRSTFVSTEGPCEMAFESGKKMFAKAWIIMCGPVVKAPSDFPMKGFRGFRYTEKLF
jgi:hypothetical protein